jgi:hypothetical protein
MLKRHYIREFAEQRHRESGTAETGSPDGGRLLCGPLCTRDDGKMQVRDSDDTDEDDDREQRL